MSWVCWEKKTWLKGHVYELDLRALDVIRLMSDEYNVTATYLQLSLHYPIAIIQQASPPLKHPDPTYLTNPLPPSQQARWAAPPKPPHTHT